VVALIRHSGVHFFRPASPPLATTVPTAPRRCIRYKRSRIKIPRPPLFSYIYIHAFSSISFLSCFFPSVSHFSALPFVVTLFYLLAIHRRPHSITNIRYTYNALYFQFRNQRPAMTVPIYRRRDKISLQ